MMSTDESDESFSTSVQLVLLAGWPKFSTEIEHNQQLWVTWCGEHNY